ncbi:hypothetical protein GCM10009674_26940 [Nesterenkonia xinjiangensis]
MLCTGDALLAEAAFRRLLPAADASIGHASMMTAEQIAALDSPRLLAMAADLEDVPPALLRRCTAILRFTGTTSPLDRADRADRLDRADRADWAGQARAVDDDEPGAGTSDALAARVVSLLARADCHDHALDAAATHLAAGLAEQVGVDHALALVEAVVAVPRQVARGSSDDLAEEASSCTPEDGSAPDQGTVEEEPSAEQAPGSGPSPDVDQPSEPDAQPGDDEPADLSEASATEEEQPPAPGAGAETAPSAEDPEEIQAAALTEASSPGVPSTPAPADVEGGEQTGEDGVEDADEDADEDSASDCAAAPDSPGPDASSPAGGPGHDDAEALAVDLGELRLDAESLEFSLQAGAGVRPSGMPTTATPPARRDAMARRHHAGRGGSESLSTDRGRMMREVPVERAGGVIAIAPTLRRAARRHAAALGTGQAPATVQSQDLRGVLRRRRGGLHTVVVVDGSSSMGAGGIARAAQEVDELISSSVSRRGAVSMVLASGAAARVLVTRSTSVSRIREAARREPAGGGTPLVHALELAAAMVSEDEPAHRRVVIISDGRPTVGRGGTHLRQEAAVLELEEQLETLMDLCARVSILPVGIASEGGLRRAMAPFRRAGAQVL